jgi:hypothetical protein
MKKIILFFLITLFFAPVYAQTIDTVSIGKIRNEAYNSNSSFETLVYLCDVLGPRLMWSPQYKESAEWIKSKLNEWGIEKVYFEDIGKSGKGWTLKNFHATVKEPFTMIINGVPKEWTSGTNGTVYAEVAYLNVKSESDFENYKGKLKGKIVLISPMTPLRPYSEPLVQRLSDDSLTALSNYQIPGDEEQNRHKEAELQGNAGLMKWAEFNVQKIKFCQDEGAVMIIEPGYRYYGLSQAWGNTALETPNDIFDYLIHNSGKPETKETIPQICISMEQYNSLARAIEKGTTVKMEVNIETEFTGIEKGFNVIAEIPGTDINDEIVTIGAHLDSYTYATAATDNTSGVVVCMEALRILKSLGLKPKRTIRIGLWGAEEEGLFGSKAHIREHFTGGNEKCYAYFNMDFGAGRFRGICTEENSNAVNLFREWMNVINDPKFKTVCLMKTKNSDHEAFQDAGLNGFAFIQDHMDYWKTFHTNMDFIERISKDDFRTDLFIMTAFAWLAANNEGDFPGK